MVKVRVLAMLLMGARGSNATDDFTAAVGTISGHRHGAMWGGRIKWSAHLTIRKGEREGLKGATRALEGVDAWDGGR